MGSNRRNNSRVTCYNCGVCGHYSDTCNNPPLTTYEQQAIRDRIRRERDFTLQDFQSGDRRLEPPLTGANTTEISPRAILARSPADSHANSASQVSPVLCVRSCSVSKRDLETACVVAARIPAVRTIFENALAEKRACVEDVELERDTGQRASKLMRRMGEMGEPSVPRRSLRQTNNPWAYGRRPDFRAGSDSDEEEGERIITAEQEQGNVEILDEVSDMEEVIGLRLPSPVAQPRKARKKLEIAPINWMKGQAPFTIQDALNAPTPGLNITLPQLLDCSPRLRRDLAKLLRSSVPRTRKKRISTATQAVQPANLHSAKFSIGQDVTSEAFPCTDDNIECLYSEAWIGNFKVPEVLVDAGAILDLVSTQLVEKLRLERFPVSGLGMRLADDRLVVLKNYVWMDIVVAGVLARIKAYEVAVSQTYQLLLSRRWLKRVKAVEYHDSRTLFIEGSDRVRRKVPGVPVGSTGIKVEDTTGYPFGDVNDEEAEDAIETLLNELDHWNEKEHKEDLLAEN